MQCVNQSLRELQRLARPQVVDHDLEQPPPRWRQRSNLPISARDAARAESGV